MDAEAERQVPIDVCAVELDDIPVGEYALVAIARVIPHDDFIALANGLAPDLDVIKSGAAHMRYRRLPANDFPDHVVDQVAVLLYLAKFVGESVDRAHGCRH